ncbi:homoserine O-succinyltransferase [Rubritalea marina]|uniref:homoserine O-succinyltransferase n=1 Tax=Rubritalea marina TaxID=361055 RepID=UPI0003757E45|nr:homoserine O-succinyltransferase [Rubritalea marina]
MPIKIPDTLPARESLMNEQVDLIDSSTAARQDIRPMRVLLLNLMPKKAQTEIHYARLLGASPLQVELTLMTTASYSPKNTGKDHLLEFYRTLDDVRDEYFDALIITGAPIETLPFEEVKYWPELREIVEWSKTHVFRRLGICWGAQALLYLLHGVDKVQMEEKLFGIYDHNLSPHHGSRLMQGFIDRFPMPVSRYTANTVADIEAANLSILAQSECSGVGMVRCDRSGDLFIFNHLEYDADTLNEEYRRDRDAGLDTAIPENYFPADNPDCDPINRWRPYAFLLFNNFINEMYQDTPFDLATVDYEATMGA